MGFICILLVYFWKKYHLYIILLADLSLLFLSPLHVVGRGFDFLLVLAHFSSSLRAIYPPWQSICLSAPTYKYFAFSSFPYFLLISSTQSSLTFSDSSDVPLFLSPAVWLVGIPQKLWQHLSQNLPCHSLLTVSLTFTCILAACVFLLLKRKKKRRKVQILNAWPLSEC